MKFIDKAIFIAATSLALVLSIESMAQTNSPAAEAIRRQLYEQDEPGLYGGTRSNMRSVIAQHGAPVVQEGPFEYQAEFTDQRGNRQAFLPWSSWFFPHNQDDLIAGDNSALAKYDYVAAQISGRRTNARGYHQQHIYSPNTVAWSGYCAPWAYASLHHRPVSFIQTAKLVRGVCFSPSDLKALAIMTYETVDAESWNGRYGQRFDTAGANARLSVMQDMYPAEWHRMVQTQLRDRKLPIIADLDASEQVWKYPVYKVTGRIARDTNNPNRVIVEMDIHYAQSQINQAQREQDKTRNIGLVTASRRYIYELFGTWQGANFVVNNSGVNGMWMGQQRGPNHPDFAEAFPEGDIGTSTGIIHSKRGSLNPEIQVSLVDRIISEARVAQDCTPQ